ncbi:MAG: hypothetical protein H6R12_2022 [Proteobacteria bacterium]|nr:hypothetical protein [Pseudomonadota bacterium]
MATAIPALSGFDPSTILPPPLPLIVPPGTTRSNIPMAESTLTAAGSVIPVPLPLTAPPGTSESNIPTAESTLTAPSTVVTLGTLPTASLTYNAAGRVGAALPITSTPQASEDLPLAAIEADTSAVTPVVVATTTTAAAATTVTAAAVDAIASDAAAAIANLAAQNSLADLVNQAHNNIASNPAYAAAAAGLYASVAVFRAQLVPATLPPVTEALPPVMPVDAINPMNPV